MSDRKNNITTDDLPVEWKSELLKLYKEGATHVEIRVWLREQNKLFTKKTWEHWLKNDEIFQEVISYGHDLSMSFWLKLARDNIGKRDFSSPVWKNIMLNLFDFTDTKTKLEVSSDEDKKRFEGMSVDDLLKEIDKELQ